MKYLEGIFLLLLSGLAYYKGYDTAGLILFIYACTKYLIAEIKEQSGK